MLTLYTSPSCTSCRKARAWLQEHEIPFVERNIFSEPLNISELKAILQMTEDGTEEIISTRSKVFQKLNMDLDDLPLKAKRFIDTCSRKPRIIASSDHD